MVFNKLLKDKKLLIVAEQASVSIITASVSYLLGYCDYQGLKQSMCDSLYCSTAFQITGNIFSGLLCYLFLWKISILYTVATFSIIKCFQARPFLNPGIYLSGFFFNFSFSQLFCKNTLELLFCGIHNHCWDKWFNYYALFLCKVNVIMSPRRKIMQIVFILV